MHILFFYYKLKTKYNLIAFYIIFKETIAVWLEIIYNLNLFHITYHYIIISRLSGIGLRLYIM